MNFQFSQMAVITFDDFVIWQPVLIFCYIGAIILIANVVRTQIPFFRKSLLPTAVIAGFLALILKIAGFNDLLVFGTSDGTTQLLFGGNNNFLEAVTFHATAIGFIAISLKRLSEKEKAQKKGGGTVRTGALIVSTYLLQGAIGMLVTIISAYIIINNGTISGDLFSVYGASGILLPMGYGQGPGQANNIGGIYELSGLAGGKSFGLGIASLGFVWACFLGVIYMNILLKKGLIKRADSSVENTLTNEQIEEKGEIPLSEGIDKFTVQIALVAFVYLCTYALSFLLVKLIGTMTFLGKNQETLSMMIWGFNFIIGVLLAMAFKGVFARLKKRGVFKREYTNNYMLNRISGLAFDFMIVASIGSIEISGLAESLVPFLIITTLGAVATFWYLRWICFKMYPAYKYEAMLAMYGMLTGTVSTGIVLLREIDPYFKTPASSDMVYGSTVAVVWGVPLLLAVGPAAASAAGLWATFGAVIVYGIALVLFITRFKGRKRAANKGGGAGAVSNNGAGAPSQ